MIMSAREGRVRRDPARGPEEHDVKRIHPFVWGHIAAAAVVGAGAGATLDVQAAIMGAIMLAAGAVISSTVCWWKPGLDAPAWQLIPAAILANPLMLVALGFMAVDANCVVGNKRGWDCIGAAIAILVAGVCLVPPFGGWLWRWWKRRRPAPGTT
jgi:hypothetical protein